MDIGKNIRMERIMNRETGNTVIIPMDHGVSSGPIAGLTDMPKTINKVAEGGANAVVIHKGIVEVGRRGYGRDIGLIIHLSGSTKLSNDPDHKVMVATVEEALGMGADAVSVHINIGANLEHEMLKILGDTAMLCDMWGMPLLAMMYPRGEGIDEFDVENVKLAARVGAELGADIIKTNYTGDPDSFREVTRGCPKPVVIAGGAKMDSDMDVLEMVHGAMEAGGKGVSLGRNAFQHRDPTKMVRALSKIIHGGADVETAIKELKK